VPDLAQVGKGTEIGDAAVDVELARLLQRAAGVGDLGGQEFVETTLDDVGHAVQRLRAFLDIGSAPRAIEGLARTPHGAVHQRGVGFMDLCQHLAVQGAEVVEKFAGLDELAIDVVADGAQRGRQRESLWHVTLRHGSGSYCR
jgi:hypothetical protein